MVKKIIARLLAFIIIFNIIGEVTPFMTVYAKSEYQVQTIVDTTIREQSYSDSKVVRNVKKGVTLTITDEVTNKYGNLWYKVKNEGYIYSEKVKKVTVTPIIKPINCQVRAIQDTTIRKEYYDKTEVVRQVKKGDILTVIGEVINTYGNLWYKVVNGGFIYSGKVEKINQQYKPLIPDVSTSSSNAPHEHTYVESGYERAHPHYIEYECTGCESGYCSTKTKKVSGCDECYPHEHTYVESGYERAHPHYIEYECTGCGSGYCSTKTKKVSGCDKCYPHEHTYVESGYERAHPHYIEYECTGCGSGYCSTKTKKVSGCDKCYPHECVLEYTGEYEFAHPHYAEVICIKCGKLDFDYKKTKSNNRTCIICSTNNYEDMAITPYYELEVHDIEKRTSSYTSIDIGELAHVGLDICGLIPSLGAVCDGANVAYYLVEKRYEEAILSGISFIPIVGLVTGTGKVVKKTGGIIIEGTGKLVSKLTKFKIIKSITSYDSLSRYARIVIKNSSDYTDDTIKVIGKLANNESIPVEKLFVDNQILITEAYSGTITTSSGLKYAKLAKGTNSALDILKQHSRSEEINYLRQLFRGQIDSVPNFFNMADDEIFKVIDDIYAKGSYIPGTEKIVGNVKSYDYDVGKVIGTNGETKIRIEFNINTNNVVSVSPVGNGVRNLESFSALSDEYKDIIKNNAAVSDVTMSKIRKAVNNTDMNVADVFVGNDILISGNYTGVVTSKGGLKYGVGGKQGHRINHVIERHSLKYEKISSAGNIFNTNGTKIFDIIDDAYFNHTPYFVELQEYTTLEYNLNYVIGTKGETKLRIVMDKLGNMITSYPID